MSGVKETEIRQKQHSEVTLTDNAALGCLSDGVRVVQSLAAIGS